MGMALSGTLMADRFKFTSDDPLIQQIIDKCYADGNDSWLFCLAAGMLTGQQWRIEELERRIALLERQKIIGIHRE